MHDVAVLWQETSTAVCGQEGCFSTTGKKHLFRLLCHECRCNLVTYRQGQRPMLQQPAETPLKSSNVTVYAIIQLVALAVAQP